MDYLALGLCLSQASEGERRLARSTSIRPPPSVNDSASIELVVENLCKPKRKRRKMKRDDEHEEVS
jgi:hypothetical protein